MARTMHGQRVVVVGASAGIGREFARRTILDAAKVVLAASRLGAAENIARLAEQSSTIAVPD